MEFREAFHIRIVLQLKAMQFKPLVLRMRTPMLTETGDSPGSLLRTEPGWDSGFFLQCCLHYALIFCTLQILSRVLSEIDVSFAEFQIDLTT